MPKNKTNQKNHQEQIKEERNTKTHQHLFRIFPTHSVFLKEAITVNFQGRQQCYSNQNQTVGQTKSSSQREYLSITPKFNSDYKHYTSSFILPYQQEMESDQEMKQHHQNKMKQSQQEIEAAQILVPKPKSKNRYCAVCHSHYEDYLSHIQTSQHKKNIKKSKFNNYIEYLTLFVNEQLNMEKDRVMTRSAKRKGEQLWVDCQLEDKTNKKRKIQCTKLKKNPQQKEQLECITPFSKRFALDTTIKSLFKQLD